jgi:hypothetical protein
MSKSPMEAARELHESTMGTPVKVGYEWKAKMPWGVVTRRTKTALLTMIESWKNVMPEFKEAVENGSMHMPKLEG